MIKPKSKPSNKSSFQHVRRAIRKITDQERLKLFKELKELTWENRLRHAVADIRARRKNHPVSDEDIDSIVEEVRAELYDERHP